MELPKLFKKNTQGKIEEWQVSVLKVKKDCVEFSWSYCVKSIYGELDGKKITTSFLVHDCKNFGKVNQTTEKQQAEKEAQAKWNKKLKAGYVLNVADAEAGNVHEVIGGGILPMLAHKFEDHKEGLQFPVAIQPKLDGQRCIAILKDKKITLWTRTRKLITSCPHIVSELEKLLKGKKELFLDGELYNHDLKHDFESLMSAVRKQKPSPESLKIQYHVYDGGTPNELKFLERSLFLNNLLAYKSDTVQIVFTTQVDTHAAIENAHQEFVGSGYEGAMVRNVNSPYENKRSKHLLKLKTFDDAEFEIVGVIAGKNNSVIFKCRTEAGKEFEATKGGNKILNLEYLKKVYPGAWAGQKLHVRYFGLTGKNKVPRFPTGVRVRNDEC